MISAGLTWWQAFLCVIIGYSLVGPILVLNARPGAVFGLIFPSVNRTTFGIFGSLWPVFNRMSYYQKVADKADYQEPVWHVFGGVSKRG